MVILSGVNYISGPYISIINISKLVSAGRYVCLESSVILAWPSVINAFMFFILYFVLWERRLKEGHFPVESIKMEVRVSRLIGVLGKSGSSHINNVPHA